MAKVRFHETYRPGTIEFTGTDVRQISDLESDGTAQISVATLEIEVKGHMKVHMEADCDRCLEHTVFPIDTDFDLVYRPVSTARGDEVEVPEGERDIGFYQGDGIQLADVLREQILLLLPMQKICREDCKGICPICGRNRNAGDCGCHQEMVDDRWAGLRNLRNKTERD